LASIRNKRSLEEELKLMGERRQHFIDNYVNKFEEASSHESTEKEEASSDSSSSSSSSSS
jgi:hypothetical protein